MVVSAQRSLVGEPVSVGSRVSAISEKSADRVATVAPSGSRRRVVRVLRVTAWILLTVLLCNGALAASPPPQRRGKVIIIRGAFTVFSLGMNDLGKKLAQYGLDVEVIADISAGRAASKLRSEYRRNRNIGPIVFIGHSRGAELGPKEARYLQKYKIPVDLIVMVDAVHQTTIPSNVRRCVNLYQNGTLGMPHGVPAQAESKYTQMLNTDIAKLSSRDQGGSINHFNIDASPWIHELVVAEVLKVCPPTGADSVATTSRTSRTAQKAAPTQNSATAKELRPTVTRRQSKSGLIYPDSVAGKLWYDSTDNTPSSSTTTPSPTRRGNSRTFRSEPSPSNDTNASRANTSKSASKSRANTAQRSGASRSLRSGDSSTTESTARTAVRPQTAKTPPSTSSSTKKPAGSAPQESGSADDEPSDTSSKPAAKTGAKTGAKTSDSKEEKSSKETKSEQNKSEPIQVRVNG